MMSEDGTKRKCVYTKLNRAENRALRDIIGETREDWDVFHICCNSSELT